MYINLSCNPAFQKLNINQYLYIIFENAKNVLCGFCCILIKKNIYLLFYSVPCFYGIFKSNNKSFLSFLPRVRWYDTDCNAKSALAAAVDAKSKFDPHLFLGPPCSAGW